MNTPVAMFRDEIEHDYPLKRFMGGVYKPIPVDACMKPVVRILEIRAIAPAYYRDGQDVLSRIDMGGDVEFGYVNVFENLLGK